MEICAAVIGAGSWGTTVAHLLAHNTSTVLWARDPVVAAEVTRLGVAMGGSALTFGGLAGMGDLVATCISTQSRNRHVGEQLGQGQTIDEIIESMNMVAEGVKTSKVVMELAADLGLDMPISSEVFACCHEGRSAAEAYTGLLRR